MATLARSRVCMPVKTPAAQRMPVSQLVFGLCFTKAIGSDPTVTY